MINNFREFIDSSRLNFEAINNLKQMLREAGFIELSEAEKWNLKSGNGYYITKNDNSILAFRLSEDIKKGFNITASHSDSPTFRIKPNPEIKKENVVVLNNEVYGGALLYTWFDRPLAIGGKLAIKSNDPMKPKIIEYISKDNLAVIPSVAIHMNRDANKGFEINPQEQTLPVISLDENFDLIKYIEAEIGEKIISHELYLINSSKSEIAGASDEFIMSGRLDNLESAYQNIYSLINAKNINKTAVAYVSDSEEIGSMTQAGAFAPFFSENLKRIVFNLGGNEEDYRIALANSFMISSDLAHAAHPNYAQYADPTNRPRINGGPVIKIAANGAYTSDVASIAVFKSLADSVGVNTQTFVNRSDRRGGSTIASITTSKLDIPIVDVGCPVWGMHSAVETGGTEDIEDMIKIMMALYES